MSKAQSAARPAAAQCGMQPEAGRTRPRASPLRLLALLALELRDLHAELRFIFRFRFERQRFAIEVESFVQIAALGEDVAEVLVHGGVTGQEMRRIGQIFFSEIELPLSEI